MNTTCADKMVFDTQAEAKTAALVADLQRGIRLKPYKCKHCSLWHNATSYT